jgi:hypothetical protein
MQLTLHKLPEGFIVTSDEKVEKGDSFYNAIDEWVYHNAVGWEILNRHTNSEEDIDFKLIAQQDQIDFSEDIPEEKLREIGWFDINNLIVKDAQQLSFEGKSILEINAYKNGAYNYFQKAQELLSDRMFTLEDMIEYTKWLQESASRNNAGKWVCFDNHFYDKTNEEMVEKWLSLSQPKSWEIEVEMETISLSQNQGFNMGAVSSDFQIQPKFTNGKIKILKIK